MKHAKRKLIIANAQSQAHLQAHLQAHSSPLSNQSRAKELPPFQRTLAKPFWPMQKKNKFVLFEDGVIWTNDSLVTMKEKFSSFKDDWKFDNIRVNIDQSSGDIVYFNHGDFVFNDTIKMKKDWLESATFRKIDGKWKMNFLHSTVKK